MVNLSQELATFVKFMNHLADKPYPRDTYGLTSPRNSVYRLKAKKEPAPPPLGNFADISYLEEIFKPHLEEMFALCDPGR